MADDILDDIDDDFENEMSDILDDSLEKEFSGEDALEDEFSDTDLSEDLETDSLDTGNPDGSKKSLPGKIVSFVTGLFKKMVGSKKAIIITALSIVLIIAVTLALWLFVFKSDPDTAESESGSAKGEIQAEETIEKEIIFEDIVEFEPFERIPLKTSSTMGSVSMTLSLELTDPRYRKQMYAMEDRLRHMVERQAGNMTWLELRSPEGKIMLKYNLLKQMNAVFPTATVRNIYFTYFIMQ